HSWDRNTERDVKITCSGGNMLIEHIDQHFNNLFQQGVRTILWFDPAAEWQGLLEELGPAIERQQHTSFWIFDGSQLELRYRLASRQPEDRAVVYLPLEQEKA